MTSIKFASPVPAGSRIGRQTTRRQIHHLVDLGLSAAEQAALARQGFIAPEYRHQKGPYYRLHFRLDGRQTTRYLGCDSTVIPTLRAELADLQRLTHLDRELGQRCRQARRLLRATKKRLAPDLQRAGYHYHGLDIRRRRGLSARPLDPAVTSPQGQPQSVSCSSSTHSSLDNGETLY
jgi:hypothetical protein